MSEQIVIRPQEGPQEQFLSSPADIVFYGGSAGGGKTFALILEGIRYYNDPDFGGVIFRRTSPQITQEGGLWDTACDIYPHLGAKMLASPSFRAIFPSGSKIQFSHFQHEKNKLDWQGAQIPFIGFDELTHFTESMFWYLVSRNRSGSCKVKPYIRGTCNPDPDSWVRRFIDWWIDDEGYAIKERSGIIRYFIRSGSDVCWYDTKQEAIENIHLSDEDIEANLDPADLVKSFTFISSSIYDNKKLLENNPSYLAALKSLPLVEREQLLSGNWNIKRKSGNFFKREWFELVEDYPRAGESIRYWDRAATKPHEGNPDPDWTVGFKLHKDLQGVYYIVDIVRFRGTPLEVEQRIKNVAIQDGRNCIVGIEQDPGQAGVKDAQSFVKLLDGYNVRIFKVDKDKETRAKPLSAQCEGGNVKMLIADWNDCFFNEAEAFPSKDFHDDQIDAGSGSYNYFINNDMDYEALTRL